MFARSIRAPLAALLFLVAQCAAAQMVLTPSTYTCPDAASGTEVKCGTYTLKNTYDNSRKLSTPAYGTSIPVGYRLDEETCTAGKSLTPNASCTFSIYFTGQPTPGPSAIYSSNLFYAGGNKNFSARGNTVLSYAWVTGDWSPQGGCGGGIPQTRSVVCHASNNTDVADSLCAAPKPDTTRTVADYSGCTYSWQTSQWGACHGGTGDFVITGWTPSSGCGLTQQNRTATCSVTTNSGRRDRDVTCLRSNGTTVSDSLCEASKPHDQEACTPSTSVCGTAPELQRTVTLIDACPQTPEEPGAENPQNPGTQDPGSPSNPGNGNTPAPVKRELCVPDVDNGKYCVYLHMQ